MNLSILLIIIVIALIIYRYLTIYKIERFSSVDDTNNTNNTNDTEEIPEFKDNIVNVYDDKGNLVNIAFAVAPFNGNTDNENYNKYKDKILFLGMTSYLEFPNVVSNPQDLYSDKNNDTWKFNYTKKIKGWLHCFRNPSQIFPSDVKLSLISESDFGDYKIIKPNKNVKKKYDFIYICHKLDADSKECKDDWVAYNKNWNLMKECLNILCSKYKYKGLLVGRSGCDISEKCNNLIETTEKLEWDELLKKYNESKMLIVPNIHDASPRVVTEAMCMNLPVLMNKNILGGWKYINNKTGEFFNDISDFEVNMNKIVNNLNKYKPRKYFINNYGIINSGKKLLNFVRTNFGNRVNLRKDCKYLTPRFNKQNYDIQ